MVLNTSLIAITSYCIEWFMALCDGSRKLQETQEMEHIYLKIITLESTRRIPRIHHKRKEKISIKYIINQILNCVKGYNHTINTKEILKWLQDP